MTSAARSSQVASRKFATAFRVVDVQPMSTKTCASTVPVQYPYFVSRTPFSAYLAAEPVFVSYPPPPLSRVSGVQGGRRWGRRVRWACEFATTIWTCERRWGANSQRSLHVYVGTIWRGGGEGGVIHPFRALPSSSLGLAWGRKCSDRGVGRSDGSSGVGSECRAEGKERGLLMIFQFTCVC